jgi:hypothetical protein
VSTPGRAEPDDLPGTRADRWLLAILLAATALYLWELRPYGLMLLDEGYVVHAAERMLGGELLYRDIFAHYAPLLYHALALAFAITGPSMLVSRTVYLGFVLVNVVVTYRLARRFVAPAAALVPAALIAGMPGQWSKAPVGFAMGVVLLALARALERPTPRRFLVLGLAGGLGLATRQDVGLAMLGFSLGASALPALLPRRFGLTGARSVTLAGRHVVATAAGAAVVPGAFASWYAAHGGFAALVNATLLRAFTQRGAYGFDLPQLLAGGGVSPEGRLAGAILLAPLVILCTAAAAFVWSLRRRGLDAHTTLVGALLVAGLAALSNVYYQLRVLRVLESALPYWLLTTWLISGAAHAALRRWPSTAGHRAAAVPLAAGVLAAALLMFSIQRGISRIDPGDEYTGSLRATSYREPVTVLGDTVYVSWGMREEIRCLRAVVEAQVPPGEPIFVAPLGVLYYTLLERPNPLWMLIGDFLPGDFLLTDTEKRREMQRLLESPVRLALVDGFWLAAVRPPDAIRRTLLDAFHPVRHCGNTLALERGADPSSLPMLEIALRASRGRPLASDLQTMEEIVSRRPDDPFPHEVLGRVLVALGRTAKAVPELDRAARLDPGNPEPLELAAELLLAQGRRQEATEMLARAEAVRESPTTRALRQRLGSVPRALD